MHRLRYWRPGQYIRDACRRADHRRGQGPWHRVAAARRHGADLSPDGDRADRKVSGPPGGHTMKPAWAPRTSRPPWSTAILGVALGFAILALGGSAPALGRTENVITALCAKKGIASRRER